MDILRKDEKVINPMGEGKKPPEWGKGRKGDPP
jgi:hypothetical protein